MQAITFHIKKFGEHWANFTENNVLEFQPRCIEFSNKVMDYIILFMSYVIP
jgi:hypothetical protein